MKRVLIVFLLVFAFSFVSGACSEGQIDINSASLDELDEIIWVGPATAEKIISERPFDSVNDLTRVYGIGDSKLENITEEGLACVVEEKESSSEDGEEMETNSDDSEVGGSNDKEEPNSEEKEYVINYKPQKAEITRTSGEIVLNTENSMNLNAVSLEGEEVVYQTKMSRVSDYLIYFFAAFLLLIILLFILKG